MSKKQELQSNMPRDTYQTGVTDPPKRHSGLMTGLFMAVIFLCGIVTALGAMNVRLVWQVSNDNPQVKTMSFTRQSGPEAAGYDWELEEETFWALGFVGRELPAVYCNYYNLPQGVYISQVDSASTLGKLGLQPADVLVEVNGTAITGLADARQMLEELQSGTLRICRAGEYITIAF